MYHKNLSKQYAIEQLGHYHSDIDFDKQIIAYAVPQHGDVILRSNFEVFKRELRKARVEFEVVSLGMNGYGTDAILISSRSKKGLALCAELHNAMDDYLILDEVHWSQLELETAQEALLEYGIDDTLRSIGLSGYLDDEKKDAILYDYDGYLAYSAELLYDESALLESALTTLTRLALVEFDKQFHHSYSADLHWLRTLDEMSELCRCLIEDRFGQSGNMCGAIEYIPMTGLAVLPEYEKFRHDGRFRLDCTISNRDYVLIVDYPSMFVAKIRELLG